MTPERHPLFAPLRGHAIGPAALLTVAALTIIGGVLRFYDLAGESLWLDEACSWFTSSHDTLYKVAYNDVHWHIHPPGYHIFLHYATMIFGDSEWALRMPSALFGTLTIPFMYLLGVRMYNVTVGLLAAAFLSVLLFPIWYAQDARPYSMTLFLVITTTLAWTYFIQGLVERGRPSAAWFVALVAGGILTAYWHYFGLLFVFLQGVVTIAFYISKLRLAPWPIAAYALMALAYIPWVSPMLSQLADEDVGHPPPTANVVIAFFQYLGGVFALTHQGRPLSTIVGIIVLAVIAGVAIRGLYVYLQTSKPYTRRRLAAVAIGVTVWLAAPFLFAYIKSVTGPSVYTQKNLIVSVPIVLFLVARAIQLVPVTKYGHALAGLVIVSLLAAYLPASQYYTAINKRPYRDAVAFMVESDPAIPNDVVMASGWSPFPFNYYLQQLGSDKRVRLVARSGEQVSDVRDLVAREDAEYIWYFMTPPLPEPELLQALQEDATLRVRQAFPGLEVFLLELKEPAKEGAEQP